MRGTYDLTGFTAEEVRLAERRIAARLKADGKPVPYELKKNIEEGMLAEARKEARSIMENLTFEEQCAACVTPLVIQAVIREFARRAADESAEKRLDKYKKLCRELREAERDYERMLRQDLDNAHCDLIERKAAEFVETNARDFATFYWSAANLIKKRGDGTEHDGMAANAYISLAALDLLKAYARKVDAMLIRKGMAKERTVTNPHIARIGEVMKGYLGKNVGCDENTKNALMILGKNLKKIEYYELKR